MSLVNPSTGMVLTSSSALLTYIATLKTNEYISKLKTTYTELMDRINSKTLLYEKTLYQSVIDKKTDEKESEVLKKIYNH